MCKMYAEANSCAKVNDGPEAGQKEKYLVLSIMCFSYFLGATLFACVAPFFPIVAQKRGVSETEVGVIIGIMQLAVFVFSPIYGRHMQRLGTKFLFCAGVFTTGYTAALFGVLNMCPPGTFTPLAIVVRIFAGIGMAAYMTAAFAIAAYLFPKIASTVIGVLEVFNGLGYMIGPPIGGALYNLGGYAAPFLTLATVLIVFSFLSSCLKVINNANTPHVDQVGYAQLLVNPNVLFALFSVFISMVTVTFFDPTLATHVEDLNLSPEMVGLIFTCMSLTYAVVCPLIGVVIDKTPIALHLMVGGYLLSGAPILLVGPSPLTGLSKSLLLIFIGIAVYGIGLGVIIVTSFNHCLLSTLRQGHSKTFGTYAIVAGLYTSALSLGSFVGPTLGGLAVDHYGFNWSSTILALINISLAIVPILLILLPPSTSRRANEASPRQAKESISKRTMASGTLPELEVDNWQFLGRF